MNQTNVLIVYTDQHCTMTLCQTGSSKAVFHIEIWTEFSERPMSPVLEVLSHEDTAEGIWYLFDVNSAPRSLLTCCVTPLTALLP